MKAEIFGFALCAMLLTLLSSATAQQSGKIVRIGFLDNSTASGMAVLIDAFRRELSRLGWIEGTNFTMEYRFSGFRGGATHLRELAKELVDLNVDVIVVSTTPVALAAMSVTVAIPIVTANSSDPVKSGLVISLARPGGNVTGLSSLGVELNTKRLEIFKNAVPKLAQVGLLLIRGAGISQDLQLKELRAAAPALKLQLEEIEVQDPLRGSSLETAFLTAKQKRFNGVMTISSRIFFAERKRIVNLAVTYQLPAIYFQREFVEEGGLMSYGTDYSELYRRAAVYVDKILKGAKPAELPVEQPTKFEFIISLKAAKQIGLTIPPNVLARADRVIR